MTLKILRVINFKSILSKTKIILQGACNFLRKSILLYTFPKIHISETIYESLIEKFQNWLSVKAVDISQLGGEAPG